MNPVVSMSDSELLEIIRPLLVALPGAAFEEYLKRRSEASKIRLTNHVDSVAIYREQGKVHAINELLRLFNA